MRTLEKWLAPSDVAMLLGMDADLVREYMRRGIIRAKDIARPGATHHRWRTTMRWLEEYQEAGTTSESAGSNERRYSPRAESPISTLSYSQWRRQRRNTASRKCQR
ncbi:MAG: hypothetical protein ABI876_00375 [Bacteroidota bacterium]